MKMTLAEKIYQKKKRRRQFLLYAIAVLAFASLIGFFILMKLATKTPHTDPLTFSLAVAVMGVGLDLNWLLQLLGDTDEDIEKGHQRRLAKAEAERKKAEAEAREAIRQAYNQDLSLCQKKDA